MATTATVSMDRRRVATNTTYYSVYYSVLSLCLAFCAGCYAPMHSPAIPACTLPDSYRMPLKAAGIPLNFSRLTRSPQVEYLLGPGDILEVVVHGLFPEDAMHPMRVQVLRGGHIVLPLVGSVDLSELNLVQAHEAITKAYADGFLRDPRVSVFITEKATVSVVVLG